MTGTGFQPVLVIWAFITVVALTFAIDQSRAGKFIPGPLALMFVPLALTNFGVLPTEAPIYDAIIDISVPMGVAMLLLRADIAEIIRNGGPMLGLFFIGILGSTLGMAVAFLLFDFGSGEAALGATMYAFMTGSTVNVIAVAQAVQMDPTEFSALFASSVIVSPAYLALIVFLMRAPFVSTFVRCRAGSSYGHSSVSKDAGSQADRSDAAKTAPMIGAPLGQLVAIGYALGVYLAVGYSMEAIGYGHLTILAVTVVAILVGNLARPFRRIVRGDREMGMVFLYLFICALAAQIDLTVLGAMAGKIILFWVMALAVHLGSMLVAGRFLRVDPHLLLLASHAGIGGPSSTAAIAGFQGRDDLVTPSILCALSGILIGTFLGVGWYGIVS
ncbi:putative membrane protein [Altererythrobacter atlanticus]|uniref:Uncharacterized protein n=1 Tax=Croceibacterium atlanticum TaxID=1267766 RepID=A0A0F7KS63_9SPHN|nr:DUF819 family protein [Croceibacterium atlanticum]AKH41961.1 hypothetical protein WYH_00913 [Croceibacterium atlanticum]MBB5733471.1 putative membrane protein [Croceibacterium atlanticum]